MRRTNSRIRVAIQTKNDSGANRAPVRDRRQAGLRHAGPPFCGAPIGQKNPSPKAGNQANNFFVFDLKTIELYRSIGESVIAEDREDCSFIWDNYFDEEDCINEYMLSIFVKGADNRYDKFSEEHYQRAYTVEEIKEALNLAGLEFVTVYDAFTRNEPNSESERIYVVARECQKNQVSK